jgi:hypothetical protein
MLIASLPALPRIGEAERLPINETRLEARLRLLRPEHAEIVRKLRDFLHWQNQPPDLTDTEVAGSYAELMADNSHASVRWVIEFRMNLRTVMAALRRRRRGENEPPTGLAWGAGSWVRHIESNWSHPDFRLASVFPWLPRARELFEKGEELLMELIWDHLDRHAFGKPFEFEAVIAFLFKWDMLRRWLSYEEDDARKQFETIADGLLSENSAP